MKEPNILDRPKAENLDEGDKLVNEAKGIVNPVAKENSLQDLQQKTADTKKLDGFQMEQTKGEVEKIKEMEVKKQWLTKAVDIMINDLKTSAGFQGEETPAQFTSRIRAGFTGLFKGAKEFAASGKLEKAEKIYSLMNIKNHITGADTDNLETFKAMATFLSGKGEKEIAAAYKEFYPEGDYKKSSNEDYRKMSHTLDGGGGVSNNSWQG